MNNNHETRIKLGDVTPDLSGFANIYADYLKKRKSEHKKHVGLRS